MRIPHYSIRIHKWAKYHNAYLVSQAAYWRNQGSLKRIPAIYAMTQTPRRRQEKFLMQTPHYK